MIRDTTVTCASWSRCHTSSLMRSTVPGTSTPAIWQMASTRSADMVLDSRLGNTMPTRLLADMDVGIDDALAIMYIAAHQDVEITALGSIHGNVDTPRAARNALRILELCGRTDVPVAQGALEPLNQPMTTSWRVHGTDGLGNTYPPDPIGTITQEHAADQIVRLGHDAPSELDLLAVGPLTNLAQAVIQDPDALHRYKSVVILGGSGCEGPSWHRLTTDANIDHDPEAADIVFSARANLTMVGVDLEPFLILDETRLLALEKATQSHSAFTWAMIQHYMDFIEQTIGRRVVTLWDPLAAAILLDPTLIQSSVQGVVDIVPSELGYRAMCLRDRRSEGRFDTRPDVRIITAIDAERFVSAFLAAVTGPMERKT